MANGRDRIPDERTVGEHGWAGEILEGLLEVVFELPELLLAAL